MALAIWVLFGLALVQGKTVKNLHDDENLEFQEHYHLKAIRSSLLSGIVENYEIWKTSKETRIDYNGGVVKTIKKGDNLYKIVPVATSNQDVVFNCTILDESDLDDEKPFLPDTTYVSADGEEMVQDILCTKFVSKVSFGDVQVRQTIWAIQEYDSWIPVRYELIEFNDWLGSKTKHEMWDYYDYKEIFSIRSVFEISSYDCKQVKSSDEAVTKHLSFIDPENDHHVNHVFKTFKINHNKRYVDAKEHAMRKSIFKNNMRRIVEHNRQNLGYKLSINQFSDKTPQEMKKKGGSKHQNKGTIPFPYSGEKLKEMATELPTEYDARLFGLVTSVKTQEDCKSSWAIAPAAAVEGALALNNKTLVYLSNQAIIDCAWPYGSLGCSGGSVDAAFQWIEKYGLPTEAEYGAYNNVEGKCAIKNMNSTYRIKGHTVVTPSTIEAVKVALVNHGPLSVSIDSSSSEFTLYSSGIFYSTTCDSDFTNHDVTLVGYGEQNGDTFWIIKNSWGQSWGIGGYMHISTRNNNCGVTTKPIYAVI